MVSRMWTRCSFRAGAYRSNITGPAMTTAGSSGVWVCCQLFMECFILFTGMGGARHGPVCQTAMLCTHPSQPGASVRKQTSALADLRVSQSSVGRAELCRTRTGEMGSGGAERGGSRPGHPLEDCSSNPSKPGPLGKLLLCPLLRVKLPFLKKRARKPGE